jgi:hypothetical protein
MNSGSDVNLLNVLSQQLVGMESVSPGNLLSAVGFLTVLLGSSESPALVLCALLLLLGTLPLLALAPMNCKLLFILLNILNN